MDLMIQQMDFSKTNKTYKPKTKDLNTMFSTTIVGNYCSFTSAWQCNNLLNIINFVTLAS